MKTRLVTNLEEFAMVEIMRPFYPTHPSSAGDEKSYMPGKCPWTPAQSLAVALEHLQKYPEWASDVIGRLRNCGFKIPGYINHPLTDYLVEIEALCRVGGDE